MTEPTLERGQTWQTFLDAKVAEKNAVETSLMFDPPPWIRTELENNLRDLRFEIDCAAAHLGFDEMEIDW